MKKETEDTSRAYGFNAVVCRQSIAPLMYRWRLPSSPLVSRPFRFFGHLAGRLLPITKDGRRTYMNIHQNTIAGAKPQWVDRDTRTSVRQARIRTVIRWQKSKTKTRVKQNYVSMEEEPLQQSWQELAPWLTYLAPATGVHGAQAPARLRRLCWL